MRRRTSPESFDPSVVRPWNARIEGLGFGGDYNPEQWPQEVRLEDIELMREAGVNLLSVAIFSWATIEPREGELEWGWLDETMDRLHDAGIQVALATATASPPPWLTRKHPEILPRLADGTVLHQGGRQSYAVTHPVHREYALRMAARMAERYSEHPALALWHVDNEIGCHVPRDYSDAAAAAFREWLRARYGTVENLNEAWGTAFWSQRYGSFDDVLPPLVAPTFANPTQQLDFDRFSSDALLDYYRDLRDTLREITPHVPTTTNLMASSHTKGMDYFAWAPELDVVANDHYTVAADPDRHVELAFSADLSRGVAGGDPWILMEHSTSAVNWQPRNRTKLPGELLRNSLQHVARGADSVMFFQWRASRAGAEKYHSGMVPHAGTDTDVWRGVVELGRVLRALGEVRGSRVRSRAAMVVDWPSWWGSELDSHPTQALRYMDQVQAWYRALWRLGVTVDMVPPHGDLTAYDLVVLPTTYLVTDADAANVASAAERGATVAITYFSGIVDEHDHVRLGGYPGAFRELLGVRTEEFYPLQEGETVRVEGKAVGGEASADLWTEKTHVADGTEVVASYDDGALAGWPAVTRRSVGQDGAAWYVATRLDAAGLDALAARLVEESGVGPDVAPPAGVEVVRRWSEDGATSWLFAINHTDADATLGTPEAPVRGTELLTGEAADGALTVPARAVRVVRIG
ncbi:beta-galactosidase [Isoptericola variabilis]|uniref:Beta-galactosidase n=1 Tax=Isoptericola variabilis (strain 225) TaxID=743718 RepID=F6FU78_ISOV2|nr:beta-galactosidase [Isoptericola variabilis]AEG43274.1 Beta-galactosidase [Isoptericola variabilis 225]TWH35209.1 beta-galactosidase [Isoptericola variabilis J7]